MRILGAVLAGGRSRRFGSDKALARFEGAALIDHVIAALAAQCHAVIVCGRPMTGHDWVADRPAADLGPLGGIAAALDAGHARGFDQVLTVPCDAPRLPADLRALLGTAPALLADMPVIGLWPCALAPDLDAFLARERDRPGGRSVRRWAAAIGATPRALPAPIANINSPEDLARLATPDG